jgi:ribonuclease HI
MAKKQKYYVVWKGRKPGIYTTWDECSAQVSGFAGAEYKAFESHAEAQQAYGGQYKSYISAGQAAKPAAQSWRHAANPPITPSYCVDAACEGNPGNMEYRCVNVETGETVFASKTYPQGTNNIGEFLGIVQALKEFKKQGITTPLYSDSRTAIAWVRDKRCKTNLIPNDKNREIFELIEQAETWLENNTYSTQILKWETEEWGEIPADYGRK